MGDGVWALVILSLALIVVPRPWRDREMRLQGLSDVIVVIVSRAVLELAGKLFRSRPDRLRF